MADSQLSLLTIPLDLHLEILSFVPARQLLVYSRCCKHFQSITEDDRLWLNKDVIHISNGAQYPPARLCLSAVMFQDSLFVYGGDSAREEQIDAVKNDLWAFHFKEGGKWENYPSRSLLRPMLTEHTAVLYRDDIYLFGGNCGNQDTNSQLVLGNAVHKIEMEAKTVKEVKVDAKYLPRRRSAHTSVIYKSKMYVYGGWDGQASHGDFNELDLVTLKWKPVSVNGGESPGRRRAHCAVVHKHYMYLYGGFDTPPASKYSQMHRFDFETGQWETFYGTGDVPRGRSRADMVVYQDKIYLVGGWDRDRREYFADLYEFNIQTHAWKAYKTNLKQYTKGICQHKCVLYEHWLLIVFGYSAKEGASTSNMYAINLRRKATK